MNRTRKLAALWGGVLSVALFALPAIGQSSTDVFGGYTLNFGSPGPKGLALAGAITATVDDPSAAVVNPAGLVALDESKVTVEFRQDQTFDSASVAGEVTTAGGGAQIKGFNEQDQTSLSFLSYVHPFHNGAISIYRHQSVDFSTVTQSFGPRVNGMATLPSQGALDIEIETIGVAAGFKVAENFSLGVGVAMRQLDLNSTNSRFSRVVPFPADPLAPGLELDRQSVTGDDDDVVFNVGLLYDDDKWAFGASYRQGGDFDLSSTNVAGRGTAAAGALLGSDNGALGVPDVISAGVGYNFTHKFMVSVEWKRHSYGDLFGNVADPLQLGSVVNNLQVDDIDTLHLGMSFEQTHPKYPVNLWWGIWEDEAHRVSYRGSLAELDANSASLAAHFFSGEDETHYAVGVGFGLGGTFDIAFAGDFSDVGDIVVVSVGLTF